ncbi:MAG: peptidase [Holophagaceae bacterium]|nr:peptidase [Holophagaceae bacterium]
MNPWLQDPRLLALGWTLAHSLWEGAAVGLVSAAALASFRGSYTRYLIAGLGLATCLALPLATLMLLWPGNQASLVHLPPTWPSIAQAGLASGGAALQPTFHLSPFLARCLPWAALFWAVGVALGGVRLAGAWWWLQRRAAMASARVPVAITDRVHEMARSLGVRRRLTLRASSTLDGPVTHGCWRPVILVPTALLTGFPPAYLEALLAHEVAHITRHDFLVNLLQSLVEVVLFYHPVAWWLSRRIRTEREHLCDSLAAKVLEDPLRLARALNALDDAQARHQAMALAARGGHLVNRIRNLVSPMSVRAPHPWAMTAFLLLPTMALAGVSLGRTAKTLPAAGSIHAQGHLSPNGAGKWTLEMTTEHPDSHGKLNVFVEPILPGKASEPTADWSWFASGEPKASSRPSTVRVKCGLDLAPAMTSLRVTLQTTTGELGQVVVPVVEGDFQVDLHAQNLARENGWAEGTLVKIPGNPDQLRLGMKLFLSGVDLAITTVDGQSLGRLRAGRKPGAATPRLLANPVMLTRCPAGTDRVVLTFREPSSGRTSRIEVPVNQDTVTFHTDLVASGPVTPQ